MRRWAREGRERTGKPAPRVRPEAERIVRAAITIDDGVWSVPAPMRHHHVIWLMRFGSTDQPSDTRDSGNNESQMDRSLRRVGGKAQGFLTSTGRFVSREEAWGIALAAGQIVRRVGGDEGRLFSENLW